MTAAALIKKIYRPSMLVGPVYARPYGSTAALTPIGNVLELQIEHGEDVQRQEDMTQLGGGVHAEVRRVNEVNLSATWADLNVVNLARATLGTVAGIDAGTVANEAHTAVPGGLLRLAHIAPTAVMVTKNPGTATVPDEQHTGVDKGNLVALTHANPSAVTVKVGATLGAATTVGAAGNYTVVAAGIQVSPTAADIPDDSTLWVSYTHPTGTVVPAAGNYEVRPAGLYLLPGATDIDDADPLGVSYSFGDQAVIEALTAKAVELELLFEGLNEADGGAPCVVEVWRVSQSVAQQLALVNSGFGALQVSGSVLQDPTKTGVGISRYYRQTLANAPA